MTDGAEQIRTSAPVAAWPALRRRQGPSQRVIVDCVAAADAVMIMLAAIAAKWLYLDSYVNADKDLAPFVVAAAIAASIAHVAFRVQGVYAFSKLMDRKPSFLPIVVGLSVAFLAIAGMGFALKISAEFSRGWAGIWLALSFVSLASSRVATARFLQRWAARGSLTRKVAIYGAGPIGKRLAEHIRRLERDVELIGVFDDRKNRPRSATEPTFAPPAGSLDELIDAGRQNAIDQVVVALPLSAEDRILRIVDKLSALPVDVHLCPDLISFKLRSTSISYVGDIGLLDIQQRPMRDWDPLVKAVEDRVFGAAFLVLLLPLFALIALAVKLDSRGPVFFRQKRYGFNNELIGVWKFRSMYVDKCDPTASKLVTKNDSRVTRIGRFIRRTSLDELPQLFNVAMGELSLVGPRPHALEAKAANRLYEEVVDGYFARHRVKPGITGWAQINGWRGETDTPEKIKRRVEHDIYYIENWSLWLDIKILLLTPFRALAHPSAY